MQGIFDIFSSLFIIIGVIIFVLILVIIISGLRILKEWERAPVLRLGRFVGIKGPGIIFIIPFLDRVPQIISTRIQTIPFRSEQTLTRDNVGVTVDAVMYSKAIDPELCILNVENYLEATTWAAQTTLREVVGRIELDELLAEREQLNSQLQEIIDEKTEHWGVKVTAVEVKDVTIPASLQSAIARQAEAERERRARVTLATAEYEAAQKMIQAADLYTGNDLAFQLRWMNILYELGLSTEGGVIMLIPAHLPEAGIPAFGAYGFKKFPMGKNKSEKEGRSEEEEEKT